MLECHSVRVVPHGQPTGLAFAGRQVNINNAFDVRSKQGNRYRWPRHSPNGGSKFWTNRLSFVWSDSFALLARLHHPLTSDRIGAYSIRQFTSSRAPDPAI